MHVSIYAFGKRMSFFRNSDIDVSICINLKNLNTLTVYKNVNGCSYERSIILMHSYMEVINSYLFRTWEEILFAF